MTKGDGLMTRYEEIKDTDIDWVIEKHLPYRVLSFQPS